MKKMFALAAVLCLALAGCEYDDAEVKDRLDDLEGRVDALEKTVNSLNINVGNLQSLIDGKLFITAVTENPEGGGYTLSLVTSDGEASQIVIKDGEVTVNGEVDTRRGRKLYDARRRVHHRGREEDARHGRRRRDARFQDRERHVVRLL